VFFSGVKAFLWGRFKGIGEGLAGCWPAVTWTRSCSKVGLATEGWTGHGERAGAQHIWLLGRQRRALWRDNPHPSPPPLRRTTPLLFGVAHDRSECDEGVRSGFGSRNTSDLFVPYEFPFDMGISEKS